MNALRIAFAFLTRIPVGRAIVVDDAALGRALAWFPAVGGVLGLIVAGAAHLASHRAAPSLVAIALVAILAVATGGLHLDGVADVFDGLGGGRGDRARILDIMRDSRIGAHGATALVLLLAAKIAAVTELVAAGATWPLVLAPVVARWAVVPLVVSFPYARAHGLGRAMSDHGRPRHLVLASLMTTAALACAGPRALVPAAAAVAAAAVLAAWIHRRLGGLTGDVYGAAIELAEVAFLVTASAA